MNKQAGRIPKLLSGDLSAPSPHTGILVEKLQKLLAERDQVVSIKQKTDQRLIELHAVYNAYIGDLLAGLEALDSQEAAISTVDYEDLEVTAKLA